MNELILFALPFFVLTMLLEWALMRGRTDVVGYSLRDTAASLGLGIGYLALNAGWMFVELAINQTVYAWRVWDLPDAWWIWAVLLFADDLCFYWFHRAGHQVRLFWAAHVNHHSSDHYNLSTALRQSWTEQLFRPLFWLPLPFLGFSPEMIVVMHSASLLYQYWLHTEAIRSLGPLELVMNSPSHHRVHHGRNARCLDRNYAGIFIIWDRLFGSFQAEDEPVDFGLVTPLGSYNLLIIAFHEFVSMGRSVAGAKTWRGRLGYVFGAPGWREDGTGLTAAKLRAAAGEPSPLG